MERVTLPIISSLDARGINGAVKQLGLLGQTVNRISGVFKAATPAILAYQTAQAGLKFAQESVIQARDLERNYAALDTVFGDLSATMRQFTIDSQNIGLSQTDAARASTFLGSVLKQAGFSMDTVASQTQNLVGLATDLAITYGYDVSEALTGMTALFRGEYDPIEKFGVAMKQSEVNAILAANGQSKLEGAARRNAEQLARLALLMQRTKDAQGAMTEQGDSLFASQSRLAASFENLQAAVGAALIPVLADVMQQLEPMIKTLLPSLGGIFVQIGNGISAIAPYLPGLISQIGLALNVVEGFFGSFAGILPLIMENGVAVGAFFLAFKAGATVIPILQAMRVQMALLAMEIRGGATAATLFGTATAALGGPITLIAGAIGLVGFAIAKVATEQHLTEQSTINLNEKLAATGGWQNYTTAAGMATAATLGLAQAQTKVKGIAGFDQSGMSHLKELKTATKVDPFQKMLDDLLKNFESFTGKSADASKKASAAGKTAIQSTVDKLVEESRRQRIRLKLSSLGASAGLIDQILGGDDWLKQSTRIIRGGKDVLASMQTLYNTTADGIAEVKKAQDDLAEAIRRVEEASNDARKSLLDSFSGLGAIGTVSREMGQFESEAVSAFESIQASIQDAFDNRQITYKGLTTLNGLLSNNLEILAATGKKRDELATKRSAVEAIYGDVRDAVRGFASINSELETTTQTVTEQTERMIDGLKVTVSRTFEMQTQTETVASKFQSMVEKTRKFVDLLKQLKAGGLNAELFKDIVDAGVESGMATAEGILAGGPKAITEVNDLFKELDSLSKQAAEMTSVVMYNNGVDVVGGFLEGLKSQEQLFTDQARVLAEAFANELQSSIDAALSSALQVNKQIAQEEIQLNVGQTQLATLENQLAANRAQLEALGKVKPGTAAYNQARALMTEIRGIIPQVTAQQQVVNDLNQSIANQQAQFKAANSVTMASTPVTLQVDNKTIATAVIDYSRVNGSIVSKL